MSENNTEGQPQGGGAFQKDKAFGNRIDETVALHEPFLLLGARIQEERQTTVYGEAEVARLLIQKLNKDTGAPQGPPIRCNTVASAIVEKAKALTPEELGAGPVCQLQVVKSKGRGGKEALVLSWIRNLTDDDDFAEFGLDAGSVGRLTDQARPASERIPI